MNLLNGMHGACFQQLGRVAMKLVLMKSAKRCYFHSCLDIDFILCCIFLYYTLLTPLCPMYSLHARIQDLTHCYSVIRKKNSLFNIHGVAVKVDVVLMHLLTVTFSLQINYNIALHLHSEQNCSVKSDKLAPLYTMANITEIRRNGKLTKIS